jgi:general nucleoside transport system permease protein
MTVAVASFLSRSRSGLILRACGGSDVAAHAIGYHVIRVRYIAVLFGGAMSGLGGAYLSLAATPMWIENMTAGRGWGSPWLWLPSVPGGPGGYALVPICLVE